MIERDHPVKRIKHPRTGKMIHIDVKLVELVKALWKKDIDTKFSCQDWNDEGTHLSIIFDEPNLTKFINTMSNCNDSIVELSFNDVIWSTSTVTVYTNRILINAWIPEEAIRNETDGILRINLLIPIVLLSPLEKVLKG